MPGGLCMRLCAPKHQRAQQSENHLVSFHVRAPVLGDDKVIIRGIMAFFKKLKDRLFNSSSKIDEGLEAIVEDGGTQDAGEPLAIEPPQPVLTTPAPAAPEPEEGGRGHAWRRATSRPQRGARAAGDRHCRTRRPTDDATGRTR